MKQKFFILVVLFMSLKYSVLAQYCAPTFTSSSGDYINGVQLGSINNTNTGPAAGFPYYSNYLSMSTILSIGVTYTMTVQCGTWFLNSSNIAAWIDFNHNFIFDPSELIGTVQNMGPLQTSTITFTVPVSALPGNTVMRVREIYNSTSFDPCNNYSFGETEDYSIFIPSPGPNDIATFLLLSPKNGCGLTTTENLKVVVFNAGTDTIFNFSVNFDINNGFSTGSNSFNDTILPLGSDTVLLTAPADLSTQGLNNVTVFSTLVGDTIPLDDTLHAVVNHYPTFNTFPWLEDFESSSPPWVTTGGSWSLTGTLGFPFLSAFGGLQMAAVTGGVSGDLIGPCFDMTNLKNPAMKFYFNQYTPFGSNYILVYGSVNGGQSFVQLDSIDLYNPAFGTYPGGWQQFQVCLSAFAGQPNVGIKFRGQTLNGYDFGIDNVLIYDAVDSAGITASQTVLCGGGVTTVQIGPTNQNYSYFVADHNFNNISGTPIPGNGSTLTFTTSPLFVNDTLHVGFVDSVGHGFCSSYTDSTIIITVYPLTHANAGPDTAFCAGASLQMNGSGGPFYNWVPSIGLNNTAIANPIANPNSTTTYILTVTNLGGCPTYDTVVVTVNPVPVANAGADKVICGSTLVSIGGSPSATGGTFPYTYTWTPNTGLSAGNVANPTATPAVATAYSLVVSDLNNCSSSDVVIVSVDPALTYSLTSTNISCFNANNGSASITVNGGTQPYTYQWGTTPIQTTPSIGSLSPNSYIINVSDNLGCTIQDTVTITSPTALSVANNSVTTTCGLCNGKIYLFPAGGIGPYSYTSNPFLTIIGDSAIGVCNGIYAITIMDQNGCLSNTSTNITGPGGSTGFFVSAGNDINMCTGFSTNIGGVPTLSGGNLPYTYTWSPASGLSSSTVSNPLATPLSTTTYVITASDAMGCLKKDTVVVNVTPNPVANAGPDISYCYGLMGAIGSPAINGLSYNWSPTTGLNSGTVANPQVSVYTSQLYTLTTTDINGCQSTDQVNVTMNPLPVVDAGSDVIIALGSSTTFNGSGAITYLWTPAIGLSSPTVPNPIATPTATTTYVLTGTDANGCVDNDVMTVFVYDVSGIDAVGNAISLQVYPNPFTATTTLNFELPKSMQMNIKLFDARGSVVRKIEDSRMEIGKHAITLNVEDLASGMYLLLIQTADGVSVKRVVKQ